MWLRRWDPFEEMDRLTSRFLGGNEPQAGQMMAPAVDVFEDEDRLELKAELPGVKPEDVSIDVNDNVLTLSGERRLDREEEREGYRRIERSYGRFTRSFTLPRYVDQDNIRAEMREGILCLTLPKREQARGRRIDVQQMGEGESHEIGRKDTNRIEAGKAGKEKEKEKTEKRQEEQRGARA